MENKQQRTEIKPELAKGTSTDLVVHVTRIFIKLSIVAILYIGQTTYFTPLAVYLIFSEVLDQISIYLLKKKPSLEKFVKIFYVVNSISVISVVAYFAHWVLNDFYLIYLIHISSAILAYGFKTGFTSLVLSILVYSTLLFTSSAPFESYIRLPVISLIFIRLFISQYKFEKTDQFLKHVLSIETSKQDFIALASHNLRTPVAAIYGYIELLIRGDAGVMNEQQTNFIKKIKLNNQEMEKITESLLQISIFEIGKEVNLLKQPSQIEIVIQNVVDRLAPMAQEKGLDLNFQKEANSLPLVNIDVEKITSALSNLIDNAIKYTEKGVVTVTISYKDNFVEVTVSDTGIGIPKEDLPKIFNKFFRSGNVLIYNKTGTGLGLYLGKHIIELHGGHIAIDSVVDKGTTVKFTLPIIKKEVF